MRCVIWALLIVVTVSPAVVSFIRGLPTLLPDRLDVSFHLIEMVQDIVL